MNAPWSAAALVRSHAAAAGADPAILDGATSWSWADLDARIDAAAADVWASGGGPGDLRIVDAQPAPGTIADVLGVLRAGATAALVPAGVTGPERRAATAVFGRGGVPEEPAVVVLTSGTTGRPRGVVLTEGALAASADAWRAALPPATGWLLALGPGHVAGLGVMWRAIAARVPLRIVPAGDPVAILAGLEAAPAMSHVSLVPAQLVRLLDAARDAPPPAALRAVPLGGGPVPAGLVLRALDAGWPVVPTYGLSEAASGVTALASDAAREAPGSAGRPLPGVELRIEDPDVDSIGEIVVTTPAGFRGYLGEEPRASTDPIATGDLGRLDASGRLYVIDRRTDRIVRGGENIAPAEVEQVLLEHPGVRDAAVVARPDPTWGQVPVAAVVPAGPRGVPTDAELVAHCRASLAGFKVPAAFLRLDALPRTGGGKLRREAVRALVAGDPTGTLARPGGDAIGWRLAGTGPVAVVLLPGTLSTAAQLDRLAAALAQPGDVTVHALDRRGTGTGRLSPPRPLDVSVHVADLVAYLDAREIDRAILVGASYGGVVVIETASRHPSRIAALVAYEPPYGALAELDTVRRFRALAADTVAAHRDGGAPAAAETFLRAVAGDAAWERLPERARAFLAAEGDGALADVGLIGLDPEGLADIECPVTILTGGASEPFYAPIADRLVDRIPGARRVTLDGLAHPAPITEPAVIAGAIRSALARSGLVSPSPSTVPATSEPAP